MKKILISLISSVFLLNANQKLEKIDPNIAMSPQIKENKVTKVKTYKDNKLKLIDYKDISYNKFLVPYSYIKPDKKLYKKFLQSNHLTSNPIVLNNLFGRTTNSLAIKVSAFGYDWVLHKPNYAQNFYLYWLKHFKLSTSDKFYIADYLLRTNQLDKMDFISKGFCMSFFKQSLRAKCKYFYGLKEYLKTGIINSSLKSAAEDGIKEAQQIIKGE